MPSRTTSARASSVDRATGRTSAGTAPEEGWGAVLGALLMARLYCRERASPTNHLVVMLGLQSTRKRVMCVLGREVVIVEAVRTPIGRGHREKGQFRDVHPATLLAATYSEVLYRAGIEGANVDDVLAGCVQQYGEQSFNIGRNAWLQAGLPVETPATTIDRQCGSAQQAVNFGATLIASGVHNVTIGSGVESMGRIPMFVGRQIA